MTRIIENLSELEPGHTLLYCDLWGCLHDGVRAFPAAVAALRRFREGGGAVVLLTNSPRPERSVMAQLEGLGAPRDCYDLVVSSGDAAQEALSAGQFGRRVFHIGPERDLAFFSDAEGQPFDIERVPLAEAESIVCTGLFDDRTETPDDYRAILLEAKTRDLKLLCANPDVIVDVGETRIYCAGAIAAAYAERGGRSFYFGKPHAPIYALARRRMIELRGYDTPSDEILCIGDGIATDVQGAISEELDILFVTGGLAAADTATSADGGPDPEMLARYLAASRLTPTCAIRRLA